MRSKQNKNFKMNKQLVEKIIKSNDDSCPDLNFENPLVDQKVAKALSSNFIKILQYSKQNASVSQNLRLSILEKIRNMCQMEPINHVKVNESVTESLVEVYTNHYSEASSSNTSLKILDAYLLRRMKSSNVDSKFEQKLNPEIVQALLNITASGVHLETLSKDIIHWNNRNVKCEIVLHDLWYNNSLNPSLIDDVSVKMKVNIEKSLLRMCHQILTEKDCAIENIFSSDNTLIHLVKTSARSSECFQMCIGVLNFLFIVTNFDSSIQLFIQLFVEHVKLHCLHVSFSVLYTKNLSFIVVLLDFEIDVLPENLLSLYVEPAVKYLKEMRLESENDFIMILSHFPKWFDIYFDHETKQRSC